MAYTLTANEKAHLQNLKNAGDYDLAYKYIAERLQSAVQTGAVSRGMQKWFEWAYHINGNDGSFYSEYARTYSKVGALADSFILTDAKFQEASDHIAKIVINDILTSGKVAATPEHIILTDIKEGSRIMGTDPEDFPGTLVARWIFDVNALDALITNDALNKSIWEQVKEVGEQGLKHAIVLSSMPVEGLVGGANRLLEWPDGLPPKVLSWLPAWVDGGLGHFNDGPKGISPLVVDLDGDGIETTRLGIGDAGSSATYFDLTNDGMAERTGWVTGGDGFAVTDAGELAFISQHSSHLSASSFVWLR